MIRAMLWVSVVVAFVVGSLLIASCQQQHEMAQETGAAVEAQQTPNSTSNENTTATMVAAASVVETEPPVEITEEPALPDKEPIQEPAEDIVTQERVGAVTYEVVAGDDLWGISRRFYHTHVYWKLLAGWNGIEDPAMLRLGRKLEIPPVSEYPYQLYLVREGDNLYAISRVFYDTDRYWKDLADANELINVNSIEAGMILRIPHVEEIAGKAAGDSTWLAAE
jgi:nucleoid-associated protein YgaU